MSTKGKLRVLVCGSRHWSNRDAIEVVLSELPPETVIIEGEARGADSIARDVAKKLGFAIEPYPADWQRYGRSAGHIRNKQMLVEGKPDLVLAFQEDASRGTQNMINLARAAGVRCVVYS